MPDSQLCSHSNNKQSVCIHSRKTGRREERGRREGGEREERGKREGKGELTRVSSSTVL
jgi:hypothetical protein